MTKHIDIVRCWWCETPLHTADALLDPQTGKVKCRACSEYDQAVAVANPLHDVMTEAPERGGIVRDTLGCLGLVAAFVLGIFAAWTATR